MGRPIGTNIILADCGDHLKVDVSTPKYPDAFMLINHEDFYAIAENEDYGRMCLNSLGYVIFGDMSDSLRKSYSVHRFITNFAYKCVDHINQARHDNRRSNLRDGTGSLNQRNSKQQSNNKSGFRGVGSKTGRRFYACISGKQFPNGRGLHLGYFDSFEEAVEARIAAEIKYMGYNWDDLKES